MSNFSVLTERVYVAPLKHLLNVENVEELILSLLQKGKEVRDFDNQFRVEAKKNVEQEQKKFSEKMKTLKSTIEQLVESIKSNPTLENLKLYIESMKFLNDEAKSSAKNIEDLSQFPKKRESKIEEFLQIRQELLKIVNKYGMEYLPWQMSESCSIDPDGKPGSQIVDFGGAVVDENGKNIYGIDCHYCGCMV
jgi:ATP-dependent Lon protease